MTQADDLRAAEHGLQRVLDELDPGADRCDACGCITYDNWPTKQAADALRGAIGRTRKARQLLTTGAKSAQGEDKP